MLETTRTFPVNSVSQWDENNEHLKAASAGDFTGLIFTYLKLQNTRVFKSQREGCQSNQKLLHHYQHYEVIASKISSIHKFILNPLSANITKWSNTLKQFVGKLPKNCLNVFPHFVGLALKRLKYSRFNGLWTKRPWSFLTMRTQKSLNQGFGFLNLYQHAKYQFIPSAHFCQF